MIKPDTWIARMALERGMISPFSAAQVSEGVISYGLSSYGYDITLDDEFKIFTNVNCSIIDPKDFDHQSFVTIKGAACLIPPNSFALAKSREYIKMPRDILGICLGKSTYARCGIIINITPLEPEWEGIVTIEISNTTPLPAKIYAGEGIAQVVFCGVEGVCETSYKDRKGKYFGQSTITLPKVR